MNYSERRTKLETPAFFPFTFIPRRLFAKRRVSTVYRYTRRLVRPSTFLSSAFGTWHSGQGKPRQIIKPYKYLYVYKRRFPPCTVATTSILDENWNRVHKITFSRRRLNSECYILGYLWYFSSTSRVHLCRYIEYFLNTMFKKNYI